MNAIYPYKTILGDIELRVGDGKLDDQEFPKNPFTPDQRIVQVYDIDKQSWQRVELALELVGPADEIADIEKSGIQVSALVVAHCAATQFRQTIQMQRAGGKAAKWQGDAELHRDDFRDRVELVGMVTGPVAGRPARFLGQSEPWSVHFDEPALPPLEGTLRVQWVDFEKPGDLQFLADYADQATFTDLSATAPTLYLNKSPGFTGLPAMLDDRKRSNNWDKALHDSQRIGIVRSVWLAMFNASLAAIRHEDNTEDPDWPAEDWKRRVLQALLPAIYPDISPEQALKQVLEDNASADGAAGLESRAEAAVNAQIGAGKLLRRSLESLAATDLPAE